MDYIEIPLTQGQITLVSLEDADLAQLNWYAKFYPKYADGGKYLAQRSTSVKGKDTSILMHRVIMSRALDRPLLRSEKVDHKHGRTLDNRRSELRMATDSQNAMNAGKQRNNTSGYKGVTWNKACRKWHAQIQVNRHQIFLGLFDDPQEAYKAYCEAAKELHGEFARLD